jgi:hypothetical protein
VSGAGWFGHGVRVDIGTISSQVIPLDVDYALAGQGPECTHPYGAWVARIPRYVWPDGIFHVATRGVAKMPIYRDADDRRAFLGLLSLAAEKFEWTCHTFCLMTNHYHLVVDTTGECLSDGLQLLNGRYGKASTANTPLGSRLRRTILVQTGSGRTARDRLRLRHDESGSRGSLR